MAVSTEIPLRSDSWPPGVSVGSPKVPKPITIYKDRQSAYEVNRGKNPQTKVLTCYQLSVE